MREHPELGELLGMLAATGWPAVTVGRRVVHGEQHWRALLARCPPPTPAERHGVARQLWRHLLCVTAVGRRRLRVWLDDQRSRPIRIETPMARRQRIAASVAYFGDDDLARLVVATLAGLPRPTSDYAFTECMFITSGSSTAGWTSGRFPPRLPIVLAGHRTDAEITRTIHHEVSHRWLLDHDNRPAPTSHEHSTALARLVTDLDTLGQEYGEPNAGRRLVTAVVEQAEREADWLAWSLSE